MGLVRTGWCMSLWCRLGVFVVFSFFLSGGVSVSDVARMVDGVVVSAGVLSGSTVSDAVVDVGSVEEECAGLVVSTVGREFVFCAYVNGVAPEEPVVDDSVVEQLEMVQIRVAERVLFDDMWSGFTVEEKSDIMLDVELLESGFYVATVGKVGLDALMGSEEVFEIVLVPEMLNVL